MFFLCSCSAPSRSSYKSVYRYNGAVVINISSGEHLSTSQISAVEHFFSEKLKPCKIAFNQFDDRVDFVLTIVMHTAASEIGVLNLVDIEPRGPHAEAAIIQDKKLTDGFSRFPNLAASLNRVRQSLQGHAQLP